MPERGELTALCLHEAGTTGAIWQALSEALADHATVLAPDRPGWGDNPAPEGYSRTTVTEQAGFAAHALRELGPAVVCGSGIGAVAAIELSLAEPALVAGTVLIEPPLLSFAPEATKQLTADVAEVRDVVAAEGREAALAAYLEGRLPALGPGADRIPTELAARGVQAASTLFAELPAVPAWERSDAELAAATIPSLIVLATDSPALLRTAGVQLSRILGRSELRETERGLPHVAGANEIAALAVELGVA
ncbi:MAG TPA: alpha/beta hydrolase [Solirubrobacterales bacterium]|nr:alpha/beta hydrolase [Solirubrobacterales bacterium]